MVTEREYLRSSLVVPKITQTTMYPAPYLVEPRGTPVSENAHSVAIQADKSLRKSPSPEVHSQHSSCRRSNSAAAGHRHLIQPITKGKSIATAPTAKSHQTALSARLRKKNSMCWDVSVSFPSKLFNMLEEADAEGHSDVVSFQPDGKSFIIHKPDEFAEEVIPKYFRTTRLSSLQRQFGMYGFKRIRTGPDRGSIYHEFFQRDDKRLIGKITRKRQGLPSSETMRQQQARADAWRALNEATR